jgi:hypothetical protein
MRSSATTASDVLAARRSPPDGDRSAGLKDELAQTQAACDGLRRAS